MFKHTEIPAIDGLFWLYESDKDSPEPVMINQARWGLKIKSFNGRERSWLGDESYLLGPQEPPARKTDFMTMHDVLEGYRNLLNAKPGHALMIGNGTVALLDDGLLVGCMLSETGEINEELYFNFDDRAFVHEECRWVNGTAQQLRDSMMNPSYMEIKK